MQQPITRRTEQPPHPVVYHYADTFWCIYVTSVVSACIAELGKLSLGNTNSYIASDVLISHSLFSSHLSFRFNENKTTDPRGGFNNES